MTRVASPLRAQEAWEAEGGGKFDRRVPKGESAKEFARSMLRKNPNAYFYRCVAWLASRTLTHRVAHHCCMAHAAPPAPRRHNVPGEDMWLGEWSEEEVQLFVKAGRMDKRLASAHQR